MFCAHDEASDKKKKTGHWLSEIRIAKWRQNSPHFFRSLSDIFFCFCVNARVLFKRGNSDVQIHLPVMYRPHRRLTSFTSFTSSLVLWAERFVHYHVTNRSERLHMWNIKLVASLSLQTSSTSCNMQRQWRQENRTGRFIRGCPINTRRRGDPRTRVVLFKTRKIEPYKKKNKAKMQISEIRKAHWSENLIGCCQCATIQHSPQSTGIVLKLCVGICRVPPIPHVKYENRIVALTIIIHLTTKDGNCGTSFSVFVQKHAKYNQNRSYILKTAATVPSIKKMHLDSRWGRPFIAESVISWDLQIHTILYHRGKLRKNERGQFVIYY